MSDDVDPHVSASEQAPTDSDANTSWSKDRLAARVWGLARRAGKVWATQGEPREVGRLGIEPRTALPGLFSLFFSILALSLVFFLIQKEISNLSSNFRFENAQTK
jgi:hypothetical protein